MNLTITPPSIARNFSIGIAAVTPPRIALPSVEIPSASIDAWFAAQMVPSGTGDTIYSDSGAWVINDSSGFQITGTGGGLTRLYYLLCTVQRRPGYTGAIAAHTIRVCCTPSLACTASTADTITTPEPHGLRAGDAVKFISGTMPGGITSNTEYFVIASGLTETVFKISATRGGSALDITTAGAGVIWTPGEIEICRLTVPAVAAGNFEPAADYYHYAPINGSRRISATGTYPLSVKFSDPAAAAGVQVNIEAAGLA